MLLGLLFLFIGQIFGNTVVPIGTKISSPFTGPLVFVFLRFVTATILLLFMFLFSRKRELKLHEYKEFALLGFLLSINVVFFTIGITYTTVIMSTLIYSFTPVLVGIAGHFYLDEPLTKTKVAGLIVSFLGLLFLISQSLSSYQRSAFGQPLGNLLICVAMLGYSCYVFQSRKVLGKKNHLPIQTTFLTFVFTTITILTVLFFGITIKSVSINPLPIAGILGFLIVGTGSIAQYLSLQIGIKRTSAFTASLFQYIAPFITGAVAIPLLHEQVTFRLIVGGIVILTGVFIATTYERLQKHTYKKINL